MENFQNDGCHLWTKSLFKNSYSRYLRIIDAVVTLIASRSDRLTDIFFFKLKLLTFRWWWQLWMKSKTITKGISLVCSTAEMILKSMCKLIHNRCNCMLIIKTMAAYMYANEQLRLCFLVLAHYFVVLDVHLSKLYIAEYSPWLRLSEYSPMFT